MAKNVKGYETREARMGKIFLKSFSGATTDDINSHAVPTMRRSPKKCFYTAKKIVSKVTPENITKEFMELAFS